MRKIVLLEITVATAAMMALFFLAGCSPEQKGEDRPARTYAFAAKKPRVNVEAFRGQGQLAFVWDGLLYVLDGDRGMLRQLTTSGYAAYPAWSKDGQWLAFIRYGNRQLKFRRLWIVRADGSQAYEIKDFPDPFGPQGFAWSPVSDVITFMPGGEARGLWLVQPGESLRPVAGVDSGVLFFTWLPDGKSLAYTVTPPFEDFVTRSDALYTVPAEGGEPAQWHVAQRSDIWLAGCGISLAGWQPGGRGLFFWPVPMHRANFAADGSSLSYLPLDSKTPRQLTTTLTYPEWLSWSPDGKRLLVVAGSGRDAWHQKSLAVCDIDAGTCNPLPQREGTVSLDPAWSPDGRRIAFVEASERGPVYSNPPGELEAWVRTRTLWVAAPDGSEACRLNSAGTGVYSPAWSRDSHHLLYLRDKQPG